MQKSHLKISTIFVALAVMLSASIGVGAPAPKASAASCDDVQAIFARGSGEELNDKSYRAWRNSLSKVFNKFELRYRFYELGSRSYGGFQYPAVSVSDDLTGVINLLGAAVSAGRAFAFGDSVAQGQGELKAYLAHVTQSCPNTKFILGGYSQGAMVLTQTLNQLDSDRILYVTTFGDPKLYLPEGEPKSAGRNRPQPDACRGVNLSNYRAYVPDCHAYEGVLGSARPYQPSGYYDKLATWCNQYDIMCSSGLSVEDHVSYIADKLYDDAAERLYQHLTKFYNLLSPDAENHRNLHNLVFLFDTTGSMSGLINNYKTEAKNLAHQIYDQGGSVALYEFRDLKENFLPRQLCDFTCTEAEFNSYIDNLSTSGGGDTNESLLSAALTALNALNWTNGATKTMVVLTDAGYHSPDSDDTSEEEVIQRSLEIDPVNIYVITPKFNQVRYTNLTSKTGGQVFNSASQLNLSSSAIFQRPVAKLALPEYSGVVGESFIFDASDSYSLAGKDLTFDWDLNGDGDFEITNGKSVITKTYSHNVNHYIQVRVSDECGSSTMSAKVVVNSQNNTPAQITQLQVTPISSDSVKLNYQTNGDYTLLVLDDAPMGLIQTNNSQGEIMIDMPTDDTIITLIPYSQNQRGIARSITASGVIIDRPDSSATSPIIGSATSSSSTMAPTTSTNSATTSSTQTQPTIIPKAPNTGVYDRRLRKRND